MALKRHREGAPAGYPDPDVPPEHEGGMARRGERPHGGAAHRDEARHAPAAARGGETRRRAFLKRAQAWRGTIERRGPTEGRARGEEGAWARRESRASRFPRGYTMENPGDQGIRFGATDRPAGYDQDPTIAENEGWAAREGAPDHPGEEAPRALTDAPPLPEGAPGELSESEVFPERMPGATAATYAAAAGKRRDVFPGAPSEREREAGIREAGLGPFEGSALPSEQGRRGGRERKER